MEDDIRKLNLKFDGQEIVKRSLEIEKMKKKKQEMQGKLK